jgi:energy-coupling factor transport system substrate-specific component
VRRIWIAWLTVVSFVGLAIFALPFITSAMSNISQSSAARTLDASVLMSVMLAGSLFVAVGEMSRGPAVGSASRAVALLGALIAIDAALRLVPSFLGASPIFALIVLVGAVFGSQFGFVMGSLTLLFSAAITAGVGPWLPFQMLCAGWVGLAAGWVPKGSTSHARIAWIATYSAAAGLAFGALMNLYAWPFSAPGLETDAGLYWHPGLSLVETVHRYASYYLVTSFSHDLTRAAANVLLLLFFGLPAIRLLERFRIRTSWQRGPAGVDRRWKTLDASIPSAVPNMHESAPVVGNVAQ